jgi:hydrogenase expression/formation protein HypD
MKYVDEYRDGAAVRILAGAIRSATTRPWRIMEVCGGQTHAIIRFGIDQILPPGITLLHGPGCPVCVTPLETLDKAIAIASHPGVIFCSFGDMIRVPGSHDDLMHVKARGGDVRIVYSPLDALRLAQANPSREVVFLAVGFETTAPANAMAAFQAKRLALRNFSMLVSHVLVPPALEAIMSSPQSRVSGFLAAGHVCTIMGVDEYVQLAARYHVPIVVTGFEPIDILHGILLCVEQLERGAFVVENQYTRSVRPEGNLHARRLITEVFEVVARKWRGLGVIEGSGLKLRTAYADLDAERRFAVDQISPEEASECISGLVLQGLKNPLECPAFGTTCTPDHPLGATMVSAEGACAAYYRYRREKIAAEDPE